MDTDLRHIDGLAKLNDALKQLPDNVAKNILRRSVYAGAKVIRDNARDRAPVFTGSVSEGHPPPGTLKRSIVMKQIAALSGKYRQTFFVAVRKGKKYQKQGKKGTLSQDAYYAGWVEYGHVAKGGKSVPAHPFMRPAWDSGKDAALNAIRDSLKAGIAEESAKVAR